jgi:molybdopterin-guanine dinucleotide biosynthesis protein A
MDLEAFILVGGKSSRMGEVASDKALLKLDGVTLAERAANAIAAALSPKEIFFTARDEKQFAAKDLPKDISLIYDRYKDRGAYSGLHAALSAAKTEWIFVLACDYPLVPVELLTFLAGFIDENIDAVAPVQPDGRVQPLCAFYRVEPCLKTVESFLSADEKLPPLRAVFEKVRTRFVKFEEISHLPGAENFFLNLNTPEDLKRNDIQIQNGSEFKL